MSWGHVFCLVVEGDGFGGHAPVMSRKLARRLTQMEVVTRIVLTNIAVSFAVLHSRCTQEQLDLTENASILVLTNIAVYFVVLHNNYI